MRLVTLAAALLATLWMPVSPLAQTSKVAIIDFERAVVGSAGGKKAADEFTAKLEERRKELEKQQQELEQLENTLRAQERAINETRRMELSREIDRRRTALTRANEDAEKEFAALREQLLKPIADNASRLLREFAAELDITVLIDVSAPETNVLSVTEGTDITEAFVRRLDAESATVVLPQP
jgi:Skp family chaperone for outer membrane proteins